MSSILVVLALLQRSSSLGPGHMGRCTHQRPLAAKHAESPINEPLSFHALDRPVLTEAGYTVVSKVPLVADGQGASNFAVLAEGSAASWSLLRQAFEGKYGPIDRAPTDKHYLMCWFARCPEDLERSDLVLQLARARDEHVSLIHEQILACVFFADPELDTRERSVLDPFDDAFVALDLRRTIDAQSLFVFYFSQFWYRDKLGRELREKTERELLAKDKELAAKDKEVAAKDKELAAKEAILKTLKERFAELENVA